MPWLRRTIAASPNSLWIHSGRRSCWPRLERFGWTSSPAPGHAHGVRLIAVRATTTWVDWARVWPIHGSRRCTPFNSRRAWFRVSGSNPGGWIGFWIQTSVNSLSLHDAAPARDHVCVRRLTELRKMLVRTTTHGTARGAFRDRRGRPRLGDVKVAGKTGNLTGSSPQGRYEWFMGLAPAEKPRVAIVVLQLQSNLWWSKSSELAADLLTLRSSVSVKNAGPASRIALPAPWAELWRPCCCQTQRRLPKQVWYATEALRRNPAIYLFVSADDSASSGRCLTARDHNARGFLALHFTRLLDELLHRHIDGGRKFFKGVG